MEARSSVSAQLPTQPCLRKAAPDPHREAENSQEQTLVWGSQIESPRLKPHQPARGGFQLSFHSIHQALSTAKY